MPELGLFFDHTNLRPNATAKDMERLVYEATEYSCKAVCVPPSWVSFVKNTIEERVELARRKLRVCSVVGFPLGNHATAVKVFEAKKAIADGATEIDMVIQLGRFLSGSTYDWEQVKDDIKQVAAEVHASQALVKVILETGFLSHDQIQTISQWCVELDVDFVKTSTGFGPRGASIDDIKCIQSVVRNTPTKIKASGGIQTLDQVNQLIKEGASRIGTSHTVKILKID